MLVEHDEERSEAPGRRLRPRLRTVVVAGAVGIACVGVGAALLGPGGDDTPAPDPTSKAELASIFKDLLPKGKITDRSRPRTGYDPFVAEVVHDDGEGPAAISLSFHYVEPGVQAEMTIGCPTVNQSESESCVTTTLPDRSRVTVLKRYAYGDDRRLDTKRWSADLLTPSGHYISVTETNSPAPEGAPVSRAEPPLSGAQLKALVSAGVWRRVVEAVVEEQQRRPVPTSTPSEGEGPTVAAMTETLAALLPRDRKVFETRSDYPYVDVFDAKAENFVPIETRVLIDVQQDTPSDVTDEAYGADAETLPDGTRVATRRGPGDKGVEASVMWTVDTLRTDGLRVVISAYNPASRGVPARSAPNLTMEQLREIALSPKWERFR
ncbi:hypothetical protein [Streptomyces sp. NPDC098781]|uniref:hypothetical protein n=1 Tax=Streptomyces sp. NPDC098781 TaxID=3366097 RepID=UPI00380BA44B